VNNKLPEFVKDYKPEDNFNGDELGCFGAFHPISHLLSKGKSSKRAK
jgi:hypothetical protein